MCRYLFYSRYNGFIKLKINERKIEISENIVYLLDHKMAEKNLLKKLKAFTRDSEITSGDAISIARELSRKVAESHSE